MKFSNGQWMNRKGVNVYSTVTVAEVNRIGDVLEVFAPTRYINHRGDTLGGPLLTIYYSSPIEDVIKVKITHYQGLVNRGPEFELNVDQNVLVEISNLNEETILKSGSLSVKFNKKNFKSTFYHENQKLTSSDHKSAGYITVNDQEVYMREQLGLSVGENVYGLGERFTSFVKNGQVVDIWNEDGGTASEQSYKNIPFYVTNKGYGVFVNHPEQVSFEVASEKVTKVQFSVIGESLEYYLIGGGSLKKVLENYTKLTGKPALPPAWSFGLWLTTSFTTSYDENTINSFIDGMASRNLPLHVFHFDCFWMKEFEWTNFEWDKRVFPDPEGMLKRLKEKGLKICVWINPYIGQKSYLFKEGMENGYLVKRPNGDVWQWDMWQPAMGLVDFTNPEACLWFKSKLRKLIAMGVDTFKTDFGERIPTDVVYYDGSDPIKMHNYYTLLYNQTVFDCLKEAYGENQAAVFARSATVGGQKYPVHWGGDCTSVYESMAESLRGGLSLCLSGFGFWSHDISGFESTATPDVYKRWTAFGLLSTHSRLHGNHTYRVPWLFDEESVDVLRHFTQLKCSLMPYLFKEAIKTSQTGVPMIRAMVLEFEDDPACATIDRQYMLGHNLMVAPVFSEDKYVTYYLPKGNWTNFFTGQMVEGGRFHREYHDYFSLPLMVRPNSLIAVGNNQTKPDYDYAEDVTLHLFELSPYNRTQVTVYSTDAKAELTVQVKREEQKLIIESEGTKPWSLLLRGIFQVNTVEGATVVQDPLGVKLIPNQDVKAIYCELK